MWTGYKYKVRSCVIMKRDHTHTHMDTLAPCQTEMQRQTRVLIKTDTSAHTHWQNLQDVLHVIIKQCCFWGLEQDKEWRRWLGVGSVPVLHPLLVRSLICHQVTGKVAGICRARHPNTYWFLCEICRICWFQCVRISVCFRIGVTCPRQKAFLTVLYDHTQKLQ